MNRTVDPADDTTASRFRRRTPIGHIVLLGIGLLGLTAREACGQAPLRFADVAAEVGIKFEHYSPMTPERHLHLFMGSGIGWLDFDRDGWPDLFCCQGAAWPKQPEHDLSRSDQLYRNRQGRFDNVTEACGLRNFEYSMGLAVGDYDNDGFADLYVSSFGRNHLYHNNGDGTWTTVTDQPVLNDERYAASCTWADIDGDGDLDLYVTNYLKIDPANYPLCSHVELGKRYAGGCHPRYQPHDYDLLIRNNGDGSFTDMTEAAGLLAETPRAGLGVVTGDFDEDGDQDFYVANDTVNNLLWINDGQGHFVDDALLMGVAVNGIGVPEAGMGLAAGDVDGDGLTDLFVTNYFNETNTLYRNDRTAFTDVTAEFGLAAPSRQRLGFGTSLLDTNNDGWLDLFVTNGHVQSYPPELDRLEPFAQLGQVFLNQSGKRFREVSTTAGAYFQKPRVGRGTALADFNHDGRLDLAVLHLNGPAALLRNETEAAGASIRLNLIGTASNRDAIGARLEVRVGDTTLVRLCQGSQSYLSSDDRQVHVGLGEEAKVESVTVHWPSGRKEVWDGFAVNQTFDLVEGQGRAQ